MTEQGGRWKISVCPECGERIRMAEDGHYHSGDRFVQAIWVEAMPVSDHLERVEELQRQLEVEAGNRDLNADSASALQDLLSKAIEEFEKRGLVALTVTGSTYREAAHYLQNRLDELKTDGELMEGARPNGLSVEDQSPVRGGDSELDRAYDYGYEDGVGRLRRSEERLRAMRRWARSGADG